MGMLWASMKATTPVPMQGARKATALVVIVDDQSTGRRILGHVIRGIDERLEIVSFSEAISALDFIAHRTPDLVLTDYAMPGMDGIGFLRHLRRIEGCADVPAVVVTILEDRNIRYDALNAGATDFLNRPIDEYECRVRCRNLLTMREQAKIIRNRACWLEEQVASATEEIRARERETVLHLAKATEYRDATTGNHVLRIARYSRLVAEKMGLDVHRCADLDLAAPMHDVGKVGIPDSILLKPGLLTETERQVMREHARIGYEILCGSSSHYLRLAAEIALSHHERFDGGGYPNGLRGDAILLEARIVAVADVFDALITERTYKRAWPIGQAIDYVHASSGGHFDPACVDAFSSGIDKIIAVAEELCDVETRPGDQGDSPPLVRWRLRGDA